jgi:5-azacytidine-induced protein 1
LIIGTCCVGFVPQGLEVEVQRLISRHRTELAAAADRAAEQTKAAVEAAKAQHEASMTALKERLRQVI